MPVRPARKGMIALETLLQRKYAQLAFFVPVEQHPLRVVVQDLTAPKVRVNLVQFLQGTIPLVVQITIIAPMYLGVWLGAFVQKAK